MCLTEIDDDAVKRGERSESSVAMTDVVVVPGRAQPARDKAMQQEDRPMDEERTPERRRYARSEHKNWQEAIAVGSNGKPTSH